MLKITMARVHPRSDESYGFHRWGCRTSDMDNWCERRIESPDGLVQKWGLSLGKPRYNNHSKDSPQRLS